MREWGLREDVVEKDYVLGWVLWGIGQHEVLSTSWAFKGGSCLKKCYIETYRFSEDLDFTVIPGGPIVQADLQPICSEILGRVAEESGINFSGRPPVFKTHASGHYTDGRIYYQGPRNAPQVASIKLDLSASERIARPPVLRAISHVYPETLPPPGTVRCYAFEEVFAEKIRAMGERGRPRDLYDILNLFRHSGLRAQPQLIRAVLQEKCLSKGCQVPTFASIAEGAIRAELEAEWGNMLAHQLPMLPPFESFWEELPNLFAWLEATTETVELATMPLTTDEASSEAWAPPPTVWTWGQGVPLESVRFAASNHLCITLGYQGSKRIIEPYSLRRTRDGNLILHAVKADTREARTYCVDRIQSIEVTNRPFKPVYKIEFASTGSIAAPATTIRATRTPSRSKSRTGPIYIIQCSYCGKQFRRTTRESKLKPHKNESGYPCHGRRGHLVEVR